MSESISTQPEELSDYDGITYTKKQRIRIYHPYCTLPQDYFTRLLNNSKSAVVKRKLLSVRSWDGREVLTVNSD